MDGSNEENAKNEATDSLRSDNEQKWNIALAHLIAYKDVHGHTQVPYRYERNRHLGRWVSVQRTLFSRIAEGSTKPSTLTPQRIEKLNAIDFEWFPSSHRSVPWETRYKELEDFVIRFGHSQVPIRWKENVHLGTWVSTQRQDFKKSKRDSSSSSNLTSERIKLLDKLNFVWEVKKHKQVPNCLEIASANCKLLAQADEISSLTSLSSKRRKRANTQSCEDNQDHAKAKYCGTRSTPIKHLQPLPEPAVKTSNLMINTLSKSSRPPLKKELVSRIAENKSAPPSSNLNRDVGSLLPSPVDSLAASNTESFIVSFPTPPATLPILNYSASSQEDKSIHLLENFERMRHLTQTEPRSAQLPSLRRANIGHVSSLHSIDMRPNFMTHNNLHVSAGFNQGPVSPYLGSLLTAAHLSMPPRFAQPNLLATLAQEQTQSGATLPRMSSAMFTNAEMTARLAALEFERHSCRMIQELSARQSAALLWNSAQWRQTPRLGPAYASPGTDFLASDKAG